MGAYQRRNAMLTEALTSRATGCPGRTRTVTATHRTPIEATREMEHAITSIAVTL